MRNRCWPRRGRPGLAATGIALPEGLDRYVTLLGASAGPCALVAIGLFLAQTGRPAPAPACCGWLEQAAATGRHGWPSLFDMPPLWPGPPC